MPGVVCICGLYLPVNRWLVYQHKDLANVVASQMCSYVRWVMMHFLLIWWQAGLVWPTRTFFVVHHALLSWCITHFCTNSFAYLIYLSLSWLQQLGWGQIASNLLLVKETRLLHIGHGYIVHVFLGPKPAVLVHTDSLVVYWQHWLSKSWRSDFRQFLDL